MQEIRDNGSCRKDRSRLKETGTVDGLDDSMAHQNTDRPGFEVGGAVKWREYVQKAEEFTQSAELLFVCNGNGVLNSSFFTGQDACDLFRLPP